MWEWFNHRQVRELPPEGGDGDPQGHVALPSATAWKSEASM